MLDLHPELPRGLTHRFAPKVTWQIPIAHTPISVLLNSRLIIDDSPLEKEGSEEPTGLLRYHNWLVLIKGTGTSTTAERAGQIAGRLII
jgi:hypothetical protein